jgi:hypothetical protein
LSEPADSTTVAANPDLKLSELYEDGKYRRYELLFAVNGGAFAVVTFCSGEGRHFPGQLSPFIFAIGMILFTFIMTFDIYAFGDKMRKAKQDQLEQAGQPQDTDLFGRVGRVVLFLIAILIILGWYYAGTGLPTGLP